jgi:abequosyltransferase
MSQILLSICIPTYNRSNYLKDTIQSIVNQRIFKETSDIEIVISDNCSDDQTMEVSRQFVDLFGEKIRYYRNPENIKDLNFERVLSYGRGLFLKLNNDTMLHNANSLESITSTLRIRIGKKDIIFFSNGAIKNISDAYCNDLDSFVRKVSFLSTWIGCFGIWNEDFHSIKDFNRCSHLNLTQVDVIFRLINSKKRVFVNNEKLFISYTPDKKGGYDLLTVFLENYVLLLTEHLNTKNLTKKTYVSEKRKLLSEFIRPWLVNIKTNPTRYSYRCEKKYSRIFKYYNKDIFAFLYFMLYYQLSLAYHFSRKVISIPSNGNEK